MKKIGSEITQFLLRQGCVVFATIDRGGYPHSACKGIVEIEDAGKIYLLDLYKWKTFANLKRDSHVSITAVDEHKFKGYCIKGKAKIVPRDKIDLALMKAWEDRLTNRLTQRVIKNLHEEKGHPRHPEALMPRPEYLIEVDVEEIVNLTPKHIK